MIGFFADPYPDELLYSACARYARRTNYLNRQSVVTELFGRRGVSAIFDFPTRLKRFIYVLPEGHSYTVDKLIDENTLLPFYQPFLPKGRAKIIRAEMAGETNNNIQARLGTRIKQIESLMYLRYCSVCVKEDRKKYGETYWHRIHQLPGILLCPSHQSFLEDSNVELGRMSSRYFQNAETSINHNVTYTARFDPKSNNHKILYKLAQDAEWLLSQANTSFNYNTIQERYFNVLLKQGFCYYNGRLKQKKILKEIQTIFSSALCDEIGLISKENWLLPVLQMGNIKKAYDPLRHLLIISFLGMSARDFLLNHTEYKPFGDPPYPCLNLASNHYKEMRINTCEVLDNITKDKRRQGLPLGIFKCDCGYIYQRVGPDNSDEDKGKFSLVREYGKTWEIKFTEYWMDLSISSAEISRLIGISSTSVGRQAIRLDLPMNTENTRSLEGYNRHRNPNKSFSEMKADYRKQWLKVRKESPNLNRQQLFKSANFLYLWLKRNDSEWIEKNLPVRDTVRRKYKKLDWKQIDRKFSKEVEEICIELLKSKNFPARICITEITKQIGNKSWIDKRHHKLPITTQVIDKYLETIEEYMIRKIAWTKNYFLKKRELPTRPQFQIAAVVRNKTSYESTKIQNAINEALNVIKQSL